MTDYEAWALVRDAFEIDARTAPDTIAEAIRQVAAVVYEFGSGNPDSVAESRDFR